MKPYIFYGPRLQTNGNSWRNPAAQILTYAMQERGIRSDQVEWVEKGVIPSGKIVIVFGKEAAAEIGLDLDKSVREMRGYVFDDKIPILLTIHPEEVQKEWLPWRVLLSLDLQRAKNIVKKGFERPVRNVEILI